MTNESQRDNGIDVEAPSSTRDATPRAAPPEFRSEYSDVTTLPVMDTGITGADPYALLSRTPVLCRDERGATRRLLLERCSEREASLIAMTPPSLGSSVFVRRESSVDEVHGLVVETRYTPSDAKRCGFTILLLEGDLQKSLIPPSITDPSRPGDRHKSGSGFERRRDPRIGIELNGLLKIPGLTIDVTFVNISMSGALSKATDEPFPHILDVGALICVEISGNNGQQILTLKAEIARLIGVGSPSSLGLRFIDIAQEESAVLEQLILEQVRQR